MIRSYQAESRADTAPDEPTVLALLDIASEMQRVGSLIHVWSELGVVAPTLERLGHADVAAFVGAVRRLPAAGLPMLQERLDRAGAAARCESRRRAI